MTLICPRFKTNELFVEFIYEQYELFVEKSFDKND